MTPEYNAQNIEVLEGGQAIRRRPAMYFDCFEKKSLDSLAFEIACHAFVEYLDGNCTELKLTVWFNSVSIWYNAGMSLKIGFDEITDCEAMMQQLFACTNLKKHLSVGEKYCQTGMATVNFAAASCVVTTVWEGQKGRFEFTEGKTTHREIVPTPNEALWTEIKLTPDPSIFGDLTFTAAGSTDRAAEIQREMEGLNFIVELMIE